MLASSKPFRASLLPRLILVCLAIVLSPACANGCDGCNSCDCSCEHCLASGAYRNVVDREVMAFEYEAPPADSWRELCGLLHEQGFEVSERSPKENSTVSTNVVGGQSFDVRLQRLGAARYTLTISRVGTYEADGGTHRSVNRDLALEWQLIQRVEPARASAIRAAAEASGRRSGRVGRGCDQGCSCALDTCGRLVAPEPQR